MRQGGSTLNPYAEAYIPIAKRDSSEPEDNHLKGKSQDHGQRVLSAQNQYSSLSSYGGPYHNVNAEEQTMNEQFDVDLDYLKTKFAAFSVESITDVFMCNYGDLDATCEMLAHLEVTINLIYFNYNRWLSIFHCVACHQCFPMQLKLHAAIVISSSTFELENVILYFL